MREMKPLFASLKRLAGAAFLAMLPAGWLLAQAEGAAQPTSQELMFSSLTLLAVILLLMASALVLLIAGVGYAAIRNRRLVVGPSVGNVSKIAPLVVLFVLAWGALPLQAQEAEAVAPAVMTLGQKSAELMVQLVYGLVGLNLVLFFVFMLTVNYYLKAVHESSLAAMLPLPKVGLFQWLFGLRKSGKKAAMDQDLGHEYDGIVELDNAAPPLFVYILYGTIIYAVIHLSVFHVFQVGVLQDEQLRKELAQAEIEKARYAQFAANRVDENSVQLITDASALEEGKKVYTNNCAACHGQLGEGNVGPNLTDAYWLHGGGIKNIFKTVKYGVPDKGMIAWEKQLSPAQIAQVSSYIVTLKGTNPPNAKEPQGELWADEEAEKTEPEQLSDSKKPDGHNQ